MGLGAQARPVYGGPSYLAASLPFAVSSINSLGHSLFITQYSLRLIPSSIIQSKWKVKKQHCSQDCVVQLKHCQGELD